jgi:hypothetical protein
MTIARIVKLRAIKNRHPAPQPAASRRRSRTRTSRATASLHCSSISTLGYQLANHLRCSRRASRVAKSRLACAVADMRGAGGEMDGRNFSQKNSNRMAAPSNTEQRYLAIGAALDYLENAADDPAAGIGHPEQVADGDSFTFRFSEKSVRVVQLCKFVRTVSALNGCFRLLPTGQYAEILTLLRSATNCIREIMYLHEPQQGGKATVDHQRFVEHFFEEHGSTMEELVASPPRASLVDRKKIHASHGRMSTPDNPHGTQKKFAASDGVFSGYTHGSYSSAMELFEGGTWRFQMRGMPGTRRSREAERQLVLAVDLAFNAARSVAFSAQNECVFESSRVERLKFEQSAACAGMNFTSPGGAPPEDRPEAQGPGR